MTKPTWIRGHPVVGLQRDGKQRGKTVVGQPLGRNTSIEVTLEIQDFFDDLDFFVIRTVKNSLLVLQLEINLTRAEEARRDFTGNDRDMVNELRRAYEREVLRLGQAKNTLEVVWINGLFPC